MVPSSQYVVIRTSQISLINLLFVSHIFVFQLTHLSALIFVSMPFQYKKILIIGATSGIGKALASRFIQEGSSVIVVGRRKEKLEEFIHEHGHDKATAVPFDITEMEKIPNFVQK